jgi:Family of unknown function (DUF6312)
MLEFDGSIQRVTLVKTDVAGGTNTTLLYENTRKKKSQSRLLRPMERFTRRVMQAMADGAQTYITLHDQSNRKKRNGWGSDLLKNTKRAQRRVWRTLTK